MEDNNLQLYFFCLEHAWEEVLKPLPQIPDGWGKTVFTSITIDLSFSHLLWEIIKECNLTILEKTVQTLEEMKAYSDITSRRLFSNELFNALISIRLETAFYLLSRIECTDGVFSELRDALRSKNQQRFVSALNDSNTKCLSSIASYILFFQSQNSLYELHKKQAKESSDTGNEPKKEEQIIKQFTELLETQRLQAKETKYSTDYIKMNLNYTKNVFSKNVRLLAAKKANYVDDTLDFDDWLCSYNYYLYLFRYCKLRNGHVLNNKNKLAFEYLFHLPAVKGMYNEGLRYWELNCWEKKLAEYESYLLDPENRKDTTASISQSISQEPVVGSDFTWRLPPDFFDNSYIDDCDINDYFPGFLNNKDGFALESIPDVKMPEIKLKLNQAFENLINSIAADGYIDNNDITKSSFAHALTGRRVDVETKTVTWKRVVYDPQKPMNWLNNICYLVRELHSYYFKDERGNRMKNKFMHILKVFEIDPAGNYKLSSSYAINADEVFMKKVDGFLENVKTIKETVLQKGS